MPPPPPPMGGLKLAANKPAAIDGDTRSALLQSIQMGAKLRKTVTNDKSAPAVAGKVASTVGSSSGPSRPPPPKLIATDGPKLSGLFEGMLTMPKLKPVGARSGSSTPAQANRSPTDSSPLSETSNVSDSNAGIGKSRNSKSGQRAPPPQPPSSSDRDASADTPVASTPIHNEPQIVPNKSSLFSKSSSVTNLEVGSSNSSASPTSSSAIGPRHNYGKPNFAPKPPGLQQIIAASKTSVTRHHSMRSPKSPPIAAPAFSDATMRAMPAQLMQSQDLINATGMRSTANAPVISRPTVAPPRPPTIKPPPPPLRSLSNTNLTSLPLSVAPTSSGVCTTFGSASNVSTLKEQYNIGASPLVNASAASSSNLTLTKERSPSSEIAPPLPPHRMSPAPPPPLRQSSSTNQSTPNSIAPPVPQRHSSMRTSNPSNIRNRITVDLEAKFGHLFHNVTEFPPPSPFTNLPKSYPSRNAKVA